MRVATFLLLSAFVSAAAGSDLEGSTIRAEWRFGSFDDIIFGQTVVVGPGVEIVRPLGDVYNINLQGEFIQFDFVISGTLFGGGVFNGWLFEVLDNGLAFIEGYEIDSASFGITGLEGVQIGFDSNSVWANFDGVQIPAKGDFIRMKVLFGIFEDNFEQTLD